MVVLWVSTPCRGSFWCSKQMYWLHFPAGWTRSSGCQSLTVRMWCVVMEDDLLPITLASIQHRFFTSEMEAVCSFVLSEKTLTGRCEIPRKGPYFNDNSHEHLKIQIFKCFMVHYNQSTLTIRAAADGSGEESGTCRPWGSSNGSSRITVWVILQIIINRHDMSHPSHFPLTSSFS